MSSLTRSSPIPSSCVLLSVVLPAAHSGVCFAVVLWLCVSCYLASVVQVLFHLPSFHQRYWVDGQRHIAECRNGRPADCFVCQMVKVADGIYSGRYAVVPSEEELEDARREREAREAEKERARQGTAMEVDKANTHTTVKRKKQVSTCSRQDAAPVPLLCTARLAFRDIGRSPYCIRCCAAVFSCRPAFHLACSSVS